MKQRLFKKKAQRLYEEYLSTNGFTNDLQTVNGLPISLIVALDRLNIIKHKPLNL